MAGETKSLGRKDTLDRFFTLPETVDFCLKEIDFSKYDCIIEPSAGNGAFLDKMPSNAKGIDINSEREDILKEDWFKLDKGIFKEYKSILVCGNPPFGVQNNLAIRFFNESAKFCDCIAFILPYSFKKDSIKNNLDLNFFLVKELDLKECLFSLNSGDLIKVPCVFQIWEKTKHKREKKKLKTTSALFSFVKKENADFRIQRVGGNAGKAFFDLDRSEQSNYFIKNLSDISNEDFVNLINSLSYPSIGFVVGPKSLSKGELIATIEENFI